MNNNRISFVLDSNNWCCGLIDIGNISQERSGFFSDQRVKVFKTHEEVLKDFDITLKDSLIGFVGEGGYHKGGQYLMQCTLVTHYGGRFDGSENKGQFPELLDHLLASGWKKNKTWKNMNTGNMVTQLQKLLTNKEAKAMYKAYNDDDD